MAWDLGAEKAILADICQNSFWDFVCYGWGAKRNPEIKGIFVDKPLKDMALWYEMHAKEWLAWRKKDGEGRQKCLMVIVPREYFKTTIITQAGQAWLHLQDTELSTFTGSETVGKASKWMSPIGSVLSGKDGNALFTWLWGNWYTPDNEWNSEAMVHAARRSHTRTDPSFGTWGVATGLTGSHIDARFFDDPISYDRLERDVGWLDTLAGHVASLVPTLKVDGLDVWVGTPYGEGDHLFSSLKKHGARSITGMCPDHIKQFLRPDGKWDVFFMDVLDENGDSTFPEQWPQWRIEESDREDHQKHVCQLRCNPMSSEHMGLTSIQIEEAMVDPKQVSFPLLWYSFHFDSAFKHNTRQARGDENVIVIVGHRREGTGDIVLVEGISSDRWRGEDFAQQVAMKLQEYKRLGRRVFALVDEREMGGHEGSWNALLTNICHQANVTVPGGEIKTFTRNKRKEVYHRAFTSLWADGHVKVVRGAPGMDKLIYQVLRVGMPQQHDDWIDAASTVLHKDVYQPMKLLGVGEETIGIRAPWDEVLHDSILRGSPAEAGYEPI